MKRLVALVFMGLIFALTGASSFATVSHHAKHVTSSSVVAKAKPKPTPTPTPAS
jgi:hypothetical protein